MGNYKNFTVQTNGQLTDAAAYRKLVVAYTNGAPIYLEQLGKVIDSVENDKLASWYNDTRAIILSIQRQPGTNTVRSTDRHSTNHRTISNFPANYRLPTAATVRPRTRHKTQKPVKNSGCQQRFAVNQSSQN
ncbi:MAG: efflux RND transporter permease subunit [Microcoleus anatoxicus]|uniref:efflux RND transporter permease subunit n=1 Tax=Microcoleus anatoxicus TaxID=2705319 RepID=UPI00367016FE